MEVRREAYHALYRSESPYALREIRKLLRSSDSDDRMLAAQLLGQIRDPATVPDLVTSVDLEEQFQVRLMLAHALARIGLPEGAPAVLRVLLSDAEILPEEVLEGLVHATKSGSAPLRLNAAKVLASAGRGERAVAAITPLLTDPDPDVRRTSSRLWLELAGAPIEPLLEAHRREIDDDVAAAHESSARRSVHPWR